MTNAGQGPQGPEPAKTMWQRFEEPLRLVGSALRIVYYTMRFWQL
ncbi:hypothetical protein [Streptomyces virginiae]